MTRQPEGSARKEYEQATRGYYQDADVARAYHQQFSSGLSARTFPHVLVARAEQRAIRRLIREKIGRVPRALDVPCGTGKLVSVLNEAAIPSIGGDVSRPMMDFARRSAGALGANWRFAQLDVTRLPFASGAFPLVVCLRLLHRVPEDLKAAALRELTRVSSKYVLVSFGTTGAWQRIRQMLRRTFTNTDSIPYPVTPSHIDELVTALGWRIAHKQRPLPILSGELIVLLTRSH